MYKKYFTRRVTARHVAQRARADASLSHVKVLRVRADVIALAPASFRVGGAVECDLYVTLIRGNSRTEEATNVKLHHVIQEGDGWC